MPQNELDNKPSSPRGTHNENIIPADSPEIEVQQVVGAPSVTTDKTTAEKVVDASPSANDAAATLRAAQTARQQSQAVAKEKKLSLAYSGTLSAWESLQEHSDDESCRALSAELMKDLESYGEQLSLQQTGLSPNSLKKPIRFE